MIIDCCESGLVVCFERGMAGVHWWPEAMPRVFLAGVVSMQ